MVIKDKLALAKKLTSNLASGSIQPKKGPVKLDLLLAWSDCVTGPLVHCKLDCMSRKSAHVRSNKRAAVGTLDIPAESALQDINDVGLGTS